MDHQPIRPSAGTTSSERHLARVCSRTFLRLWTYPNVHRDQGHVGKGGDGKEIADVLAVFGQHIILFSDKECGFSSGSAELQVRWRRWHRDAVLSAARSLYGAYRWLQQNPDRIFLDRRCRVPLPIRLPSPESAVFHLIVVARGVGAAARAAHGGSGSLRLSYGVPEPPECPLPFTVQEVDQARPLIHVLDEITLDIILAELDTAADLVAYLSWKERFLRAGHLVLAAGEEDLLAVYMEKRAAPGGPTLQLPGGSRGVAINEGEWAKWSCDPNRMSRQEADKVSYLWDMLLDDVAADAFAGQLLPQQAMVSDHERLLKIMAMEPRFQRRMLSQALLDVIETTPKGATTRRTILSTAHAGTAYVFLVVPPRKSGWTEDEYRKMRRFQLGDYCLFQLSNYRHFRQVIGIATESGVGSGRSHDFHYLRIDAWTTEHEEAAKTVQQFWKFKNPTAVPRRHHYEAEYPMLADDSRRILSPSAPCPCGSPRTYAQCCGAAVL